VEETLCVILCAHSNDVGSNDRCTFAGGDEETVGSGDCNCMSLCIVPPRTLSSLLIGRKLQRGGGWRHDGTLRLMETPRGRENRHLA